MSITNPLVQCPRCDLGGEWGCPCCGGEGMLPKDEANAWLAEEAKRVEWEETEHRVVSLFEPSVLEEDDPRTTWEELPEAGTAEAAAQWVRHGAGVVESPAAE